RLLPKERRAALTVVGAPELTRAAAQEVAFLTHREAGDDGQDVAHALSQAIAATQSDFGAAQLLELGIGCESFHGDARAHTREPAVKPSFAIESTFLRVEASPWEASHRAGDGVIAQNRVCARCHQVLFSRYPFTGEGGHRAPPEADGARQEAGGSH